MGQNRVETWMLLMGNAHQERLRDSHDHDEDRCAHSDPLRGGQFRELQPDVTFFDDGGGSREGNQAKLQSGVNPRQRKRL